MLQRQSEQTLTGRRLEMAAAHATSQTSCLREHGGGAGRGEHENRVTLGHSAGSQVLFFPNQSLPLSQT